MLDSGRPGVPLAYYHLQGLMWVVLGGALLAGMVLYRAGLANLGAAFDAPLGPLLAWFGAVALLWPVRAYYQRRYGFRYPAQPPPTKTQIALSVLAGLLMGAAYIVATVVWVFAEPPISFWACS